ncbi:sensor domain-containing protein [Arthrobacter sp. H41]|uniref:sensor domain-containing protein n=1 Tax=Arthrobacter sp. H41 TaxID=1312978 RepID=UPI0004AE380A|nr:EAL domain-containing protein [Arthrobacter sp. H41]
MPSLDGAPAADSNSAVLDIAALFESVVVNANDVVLVAEAEPVDLASGGPKVIYVNPAFTRMTGYEADEIVGLTPRILQSPKTDRAELDRLRTALHRWEPVEVELLNVRKDGVEFRSQISITPVADARGWYTHWVSIQRDITARKHREIAVQTMLDSTSDLLIILDDEQTVTSVSATAERILGLAPHCLDGTKFLTLVHPDDRAGARTLLAPRPGLRLGPTTTAELRLQHSADDSWRWLEASVADLDAGAGQDPHHSLVLSCTDITEHKHTEAALQDLNHRFRSAFDDAPIGMAVTSPCGRFLQVNRALSALLGRDETELLSISVQDITHPDDADLAERQRQSLLQGLADRHRHETRFLHADGAVVGILHSSSVVPGADGTPALLIDHIEDITERQAFEATLQHQALHDVLTGLPNRALFMDRLDQALQAGRGARTAVAVLFCDVDRFKSVNDTYGHHAGDQVLTLVAERLQSVVRQGDTVARLGGDEFVVLCRDATPDRAATTAARLLAALRSPLTVDGTEITVSASVGIALSRPEHTTAEELLRDSDDAMYAAKDSGRDRAAVYDETLGTRFRMRVQLESELQNAIHSGQLRLHYQPQVALTDGEVVGLEALVRWEHPHHGLLMPGDFIDVAEEAGLITDLGQWVLTEALREVVRRRARGGAVPVVWVNVSASELENPAFAVGVEQCLRVQDLPGTVLGLEITESVLMVNLERARDTLAQLRSSGVHLAIDDFGTGYSSLSYLAQFPVDTIKIDGSFTAGLDDDARRRESFAIVNAVIGLAHALKLRIIAEGIETTSQAQALHGLGCDYGQGYLLGRPTPHGKPTATPPLHQA